MAGQRNEGIQHNPNSKETKIPERIAFPSVAQAMNNKWEQLKSKTQVQLWNCVLFWPMQLDNSSTAASRLVSPLNEICMTKPLQNMLLTLAIKPTTNTRASTNLTANLILHTMGHSRLDTLGACSPTPLQRVSLDPCWGFTTIGWHRAIICEARWSWAIALFSWPFLLKANEPADDNGRKSRPKRTERDWSQPWKKETSCIKFVYLRGIIIAYFWKFTGPWLTVTPNVWKRPSLLGWRPSLLGERALNKVCLRCLRQDSLAARLTHAWHASPTVHVMAKRVIILQSFNQIGTSLFLGSFQRCSKHQSNSKPTKERQTVSALLFWIL